MVNPSTAQARVVVDELIRGGVRDVVLCPGSRNAPLAFALHDADRAGRLRLHVRIDERTAGYLAIGLAVAERAPVCVAMTSGTAVANLGPAVVEANYARVPLIVLSAPTGRTSCSAPAPTRRWSSWATSARRCARRSASGLAEGAYGADGLAQRAVAFGDVPSSGGRHGISIGQRGTGAVRHPAARAAGARRRTRSGDGLRTRGPPRRQAVDLHAAGDLRPAARHRPDARHGRHRRARRGRPPESRRAADGRRADRAARAQPAASVRAAAAAPAAGHHAGPPDAAPAGLVAAGRSRRCRSTR